MRTLKTVPAQAPVDGVHYCVTGAGEHTIVLLHGFSDNLTTWNRVVPPLAVNHRVIAIDLPGFGNSSRPWTRPLLPGYVDIVRAVLDAEDVSGPVSLMGNSMGAVVSLLFAARYPSRADGIVLIDMPGLRSVPRVWRMAMSKPSELGLRTALRWVPDRAAQFGLGWAYTHIAAARPQSPRPGRPRGVHLALRAARQHRRHHAARPHGRPRAADRPAGRSRRHDQRSRPARLRRPRPADPAAGAAADSAGPAARSCCRAAVTARRSISRRRC